jgi:hypothetical protein
MYEEIIELVKPYIVGTIKGFGAGAGAAGIGYLKNKGESFDGLKFTKTVIVGGVTGALAEGFGISPKTTDEYLAYPFVIYVIDAMTKVVWRRALEPIYRKIKELLS